MNRQRRCLVALSVHIVHRVPSLHLCNRSKDPTKRLYDSARSSARTGAEQAAAEADEAFIA